LPEGQSQGFLIFVRFLGFNVRTWYIGHRNTIKKKAYIYTKINYNALLCLTLRNTTPINSNKFTEFDMEK